MDKIQFTLDELELIEMAINFAGCGDAWDTATSDDIEKWKGIERVKLKIGYLKERMEGE